MNKDSFFILGPHITWIAEGETLHVDTPTASVELGGLTIPRQFEFEKFKEGVTAEALDLPTSIIDTLITHGIIWQIAFRPPSTEYFLKRFFDVCDTWVEGIFHSPFWSRFMAGQSRQEEVLHFIAQLYHRTLGADLHNRLAFERCPSPAIRTLLEQHYREELGHAPILAEGLARCGVHGQALINTQPLHATRALIRYMIDMADEPYSYLGCYGIFHAPSTVRSEGELIVQFQQFAELYPYAAPGFEAICKHTRLDYQLGHDEIMLEELLEREGMPTHDEIIATFRGARGAADAFRAIFDALNFSSNEEKTNEKTHPVLAT